MGYDTNYNLALHLLVKTPENEFGKTAVVQYWQLTVVFFFYLLSCENGRCLHVTLHLSISSFVSSCFADGGHNDKFIFPSCRHLWIAGLHNIVNVSFYKIVFKFAKMSNTEYCFKQLCV